MSSDEAVRRARRESTVAYDYKFSIRAANDHGEGDESIIRIRFKLKVEGLNFHAPCSVIAKVGTRKFRLRRPDDFVQWGYLVDPPSYRISIHDGTSFLNRAAASLRRRTLRLALDVNTVVQLATRCGRSPRRTFRLEFDEIRII